MHKFLLLLKSGHQANATGALEICKIKSKTQKTLLFPVVDHDLHPLKTTVPVM